MDSTANNCNQTGYIVTIFSSQWIVVHILWHFRKRNLSKMVAMNVRNKGVWLALSAPFLNELFLKIVGSLKIEAELMRKQSERRVEVTRK